MNDFTPEDLRALVARLDPMRVPPHRAAEEMARVRRENPALADAAGRFLADLARLHEEMASLPPAAQRERLTRLGAEDADLARMLGEQLHVTEPRIHNPNNIPLPPEAFRPPVPSRYAVVRELGRGGMAVVLLARDSDLGRDVALKVMLNAAFASPDVRVRFRREAQAVAGLLHPNVVRIHDVGEHQNQPYLSLEFCPGGNLAEYLAAHPVVPARTAAGWVRALAAAIHTAHEAGVIHRDLKPANVLLLDAGNPTGSTLKIADFGLAHRLDEDRMTQTGLIAGTPSYMAPEQAGGDKVLGPAVDTYALGAILYHCLTGRPPFVSGSPKATLDLVQTAELIAPRKFDPTIPKDLEAVCLRCLERRPGDRYASAADLADDLGRFLDGTPTRARPLGVAGRAWKGFRRKPRTYSAVAAALLCVAGAFSYAARAEAARVDADNGRRESALSYAEERADLAQQKVEEAERHLHENQVMAAINLSRQGDWKHALPLFDEAIARNRPDRPALEARRLPGWLLAKDPRSIQAEFVRLLALLPAFAPEDAALVRLYYGDYLHSDMGRLEEAARFVREAHDSGKLGAADAAYARGLLSARTREALGHFRRAVALESFHPRAHHALSLTHLIRGELAAARDRARLLENFFPDDPVPHLVRAFADTFEGEYDSSMAHLARLGGQCPPERVAALRAFMSRLHGIHRRLGLEDPDDMKLLANVPAFVGMIDRATKAGNGPLPFAFNVPVSKWLAVKLQDMLEAAKATFYLALGGETFVNLAVTTLEAVCEEEAEPLLHQMLGTAYLKRAYLHDKAKRSKETVAAVERACATYRRGAVAPTMAPKASTRYKNLFAALQADSILLAGHTLGEHVLPAARVEGVKRRVQVGLPELLIQGRRFPAARLELLTATQLLRHLPPSVALLLLDDWQRDAPDDVLPLKQRIRLAMAREEWVLSTSLLGELAEKSPQDKDHPVWQQEVDKKLAEACKE